MVSLLLAGALLHTALAMSDIEGQVVGPDGRPVAHAQVFLEPGIEGILRDTITSETGGFRFDEVAPGAAGIFAVAPGFGFAGQHLEIALGEETLPVSIALHEATTIRGKITDPAGDPVNGARVTRIGVKGTHKVGIPIAKLRAYGYPEPASDDRGNFMVPSIPAGSLIDLKIGHPRFAQEGVMDVPAGSTDLAVSLHPGVLVEGEVFARGGSIPVGQAGVLIRNAQPPHDTATAQSNLQGKFSIRLKPGVYMYRAHGAGMETSGWERLAISGEHPLAHVRLTVAGTGSIHGNVRDAVTGEPVRGVRVSLATNGTRAAVVRTGPGGDFGFRAGEGENVVYLDAVPGYFPPDTQHVKVTVEENVAVELPGMWLKPLPAYEAVIIDQDQHPVAGALVGVLRPRQFGWYEADANGRVTIRVQALPPDGQLLARAEHPDLPAAALFRIEQSQSGTATVQLFDVGAVEGTVKNGRGRTIEGASIGAFFPGESASDATLLWQTFSGPDGQFSWDAVVPGVPIRCAARTGQEASGESATFNLAPGERKADVEITVDEGAAGTSMLGETLAWYDWALLCGELPEPEARAGRPAMIVYTTPANTPAYRESLAQLARILKRPDLLIILVSDGVPDCDEGTLPVVSGTPANGATVLLLDGAGRVVFESTGTPPLQRLRNLH